jgi:hypothetical protein
MLVFHPAPHKNSVMVFWPVVRSLHMFCKRSRSWSCLCWLRLTAGLPTASCWIIVPTVASSYWQHSMTRHIDEWACPTRLANLLFQPSHMLLVPTTPLTVASCTFEMAGGNIGGLRLKTRRAAWFCAAFSCLSLPLM